MFQKKIVLVILLLTGIYSVNMAQQKKIIQRNGKSGRPREKGSPNRPRLRYQDLSLAVKDNNDVQQIKAAMILIGLQAYTG